MPDLTDTAKSYWSDLLGARIERKMKQVQAQKPDYFDQIGRQGHTEALEALGLKDLYVDLIMVHNDEIALAREKSQVQKSMIAAVRKIPIADVAEPMEVEPSSDIGLPQEVATAINRLNAAYQQKLLVTDPLGLELLRLQAEKAALPTTIWLATNPPALKRLWAEVNALLGDERTDLEVAALADAMPREA